MHLPSTWILVAALACTAASPPVARAHDPGGKPTVVAQGKVDLNAPPADFVTKERDAQKDASKDEEAGPKTAPSGVSLSVTGSMAAQVTVTNGNASSAK